MLEFFVFDQKTVVSDGLSTMCPDHDDCNIFGVVMRGEEFLAIVKIDGV